MTNLVKHSASPGEGASDAGSVDSSVHIARRAMALAFSIVLIGIGLLASERLLLRSQLVDAAERLQEVTAVADSILLGDERATNAARMAAATQDPSWLTRYEEAVTQIDLALDRARELTPNEIERHIQEASAANDRLVKMERRALQDLQTLAGAQSIFESADYRFQKGILTESVLSLRSRMLGAARSEWENLKRLSRWLTFGIFAAVIGSLIFLWWRMTGTLSVSSEAFAASEQQLKWMATHDSLTGLANRWQFIEEQRAYTGSHGADQKIAVFILDVDCFKQVNDCFGHRVGDEVLKVVARRLGELTDRGVVARLGGDEFGILLPFTSDEIVLTEFAQRILDEVQQPIKLANLRLNIGISVGYTVCIEDGDSNPLAVQDGSLVKTTFRRADMALSAAKVKGRGCYHRFEQQMEQELFNRVELESEIEGAIKSGEIVPYYQPLVDMRSGRVIGFEVLARWQHPTKGLLPPSVFIPVAESTGTIGEMTYSLLGQAVRDAKGWPDHATLSVNLSPVQLADTSLVGRILTIASEASFPVKRLEIEITENALVENMSTAVGILTELKRVGVRVALDDFGAGYAGVRYLREFRFDRLKIDRSFIHDLSSNADEVQMVKAIVRLARALKMETVAEGIEDRLTCDHLLQIGCVLGQGYFFAKPHPAAETEHYFRDNESRLIA